MQFVRSIVLLALLLPLQSCMAGVKNNETTTLTGTVRVVGNEPFPRVVLTVPGTNETGPIDYVLTGKLVEELQRHHQNHSVALEGTFCSPPPRATGTHCFTPRRITILDGQ